ncbi:MAG: restriction endonuclease subunit S [Chloroflexi bacterium]|nr:restriction endonuclease subunit S [Chloroflexota bacterium]
MERWTLPEGWEWRKLASLANEDANQIRPSEFASELFNYWGLDAIKAGQFVEPGPNWIPGSDVHSTCIRFSTKHVLYAKLRPYLNKVVVPSQEGIGTTEWIVLTPHSGQVNRHYLAYALRTPSFVDYATANSTGARMPRVRKEAFWQADIPVPYPNDPRRSLETQRRIVARLDALLAEVAEAKRITEWAPGECEELYRAIIADQRQDEYSLVPMSELVRPRQPDVTVRDDEEYHFAGTLSFGRGMFYSRKLMGSEFSYPRLIRLRKDDFVYPKLMAWEGAFGIVTQDLAGMVVSPEFVVFDVNQSCVLPEVLDVYFRTPSTWERMAAISTGTNARRRRLYPQDLMRYLMPLPPMETQFRLRMAVTATAEMKRQLAQATDELKILEQALLAQAFCGEL